jgi:hypothetical protein
MHAEYTDTQLCNQRFTYGFTIPALRRSTLFSILRDECGYMLYFVAFRYGIEVERFISVLLLASIQKVTCLLVFYWPIQGASKVHGVTAGMSSSYVTNKNSLYQHRSSFHVKAF